MQLHKRQKLQPQSDATIDDIRHRYETRAAAMKCPVHSRPPVVRVTGHHLQSLEIHIEGCCTEFVEKVRQSLRATL